MEFIDLKAQYSKLKDKIDANIHKVLDNGNVEVKFKSGGKLAMCYEFFKWGANVKIKKPVELREYYRDYLKWVLENV